MEEINLKWLHQFEIFLSKTQGVNGRAIYLRSLRAVCNYAVHTNAVQEYAFKNFSIRQEPTRKRSVSVELFRKFMNHPAPPRLQRYRDYFLLMFYLIGINSKDLLLARKDCINNGRLEYIREKTHKRYSVKVEPEAEELLKKYAGEKYLLEAMDHCKDYRNFAHEMNDKLKEIGEVAWEMVPDPDDLFGTPHLLKTVTPVIPEISTYYARHCWATFAYEAGVPLDVISQALGHSSGNRTTLIYVKFNQEAVDEAVPCGACRGYSPFFCDRVGGLFGGLPRAQTQTPALQESRLDRLRYQHWTCRLRISISCTSCGPGKNFSGSRRGGMEPRK